MKSDGNVKPIRALFVPLTFIVLAISLTVLFANERRNFKYLLSYYELSDPFDSASDVLSETSVGSVVVEPAKRGKRNILTTVKPVSGASNFNQKSAPQICEFFLEKGFSLEPWAPSGMAEGISECSAEKKYKSQSGEDPATASLYILIRGKGNGDVSSLRMKLVAPVNDAGKLAYADFRETFDEIVDLAGWKELEDLKKSILKLQDKALDKVDISAQFFREKMNEDAYNLIIKPSSGSPNKFVAAPKSK